MKPHEERVVKEKQALDQKLDGLGAFLVGDVFRGVPVEEQVRLRFQHWIMQKYSEILGERIAAFPSGD